MATEILRYAAFTRDGEGGNPAGVVLDASGLDASQMLAIAAEVGYSESAFLMPRADEPNVYDVRYFSPLDEVPFCGHATIASAIALVERSPADELIFHTPVGFVSVSTRSHQVRAGRRTHQRLAARRDPRPRRWCRPRSTPCTGPRLILIRRTRSCWPTRAPSI